MADASLLVLRARLAWGMYRTSSRDRVEDQKVITGWTVQVELFGIAPLLFDWIKYRHTVPLQTGTVSETRK